MINDPLYNHTVFGPNKGKGGIQGKSDAQLIQDLIAIHNAENWLGMDGDSELSMFNKDDKKEDMDSSPSKTPSPNSTSPTGDSITTSTGKAVKCRTGCVRVQFLCRVQILCNHIPISRLSGGS